MQKIFTHAQCTIQISFQQKHLPFFHDYLDNFGSTANIPQEDTPDTFETSICNCFVGTIFHSAKHILAFYLT